MADRRHDRPERCTVALQSVDNQPERYLDLTFQELAKEACSGMPVAPQLNKNIYHVTVLIHGALQMLPFTVNRHEHLVEEPHISEVALPSFQLTCVLRTELQTPLSDGFIGNDDPALGEQIFHIPEAQAEPIVMPDGVADYFGRKTVSVIGRSAAFHQFSLPSGSST